MRLTGEMVHGASVDASEYIDAPGWDDLSQKAREIYERVARKLNEKIPVMTADIVVLTDYDRVLLIQRKNEPFKDCWALPGGKLDPEDESIETCARRELCEETSFQCNKIKLLGVYSRKERDPRGRYISTAFLVRVPFAVETKAGDDAAETGWFDAHNLPEMAFDHATIILDAICYPIDRSEWYEIPGAIEDGEEE